MTTIPLPRVKTEFLHGKWTPDDSARLYGVTEWGKGYVGVNAQGHATVMPRKGLDRWESALMRFLEEGERVAWVSLPAGAATTAS